MKFIEGVVISGHQGSPFEPSQRAEDYRLRLLDFMETHVYPAEPVYGAQMRESGNPHHHPQVIEDLKYEARQHNLWNLFHPHPQLGPGLSNLEYAPLAEIMGRSPWLAPEACNCQAPDTGNMELLHLLGTEDQKRAWLEASAGQDNPLIICHDRAGGRKQRRHQHLDNDPPGWRPIRDQRPQMVVEWGHGPRIALFYSSWADRTLMRPSIEQHTILLVPIDRDGITDPARPVRCSVTMISTVTLRSSSTMSRVPAANVLGQGEAASLQPKCGSGPAGSTTACVQSAWPNEHSNCYVSVLIHGLPSAPHSVTERTSPTGWPRPA